MQAGERLRAAGAGVGIGLLSGAGLGLIALDILDLHPQAKTVAAASSDVIDAQTNVALADKHFLRLNKTIGSACVLALNDYRIGADLSVTPEDTILSDMLADKNVPCGTTHVEARKNIRVVLQADQQIFAAKNQLTFANQDLDDAEAERRYTRKFAPFILIGGLAIGVAVGIGSGFGYEKPTEEAASAPSVEEN